MPGSPLRKILIAVGLLGLALMGLIFLVLFRTGLLSMIFDQNPGPFDRPRLEAIVEQVRQARLKPDTEQQFFLNDLSNPKSIRVLSKDQAFPDTGKGAGLVWAQASPEGALTVVIVTRDLGHAGVYGFAYSDAPLTLTQSQSGRFYLHVPGPLHECERSWQLDEHWWKVSASD